MTVQNYDDTQLKALGKASADLSSVSGIPMDQAVTQKLSSLQLNQEQVRRVVEHANIQAFRAKHASMSAPHRVVEFDSGPADPGVVWSQLRASSDFSGAPIDLSPSDYAAEPSMKAASVPFSAFSTTEADPAAAAQKLASLHAQLDQAHQILVSEREGAGMLMRQELASLGEQAKSAMAEGVSPSEILMAWDAESPAYLETAARAVGLPEDLGKVASRRQINPASSVVQHYVEFTKQAGVYSNRNQAVLEVERNMVAVEESLKEAGWGRLLKGVKRMGSGILTKAPVAKSGVSMAHVAPKVRASGRTMVGQELAKGTKAVGGAVAGGAKAVGRGAKAVAGTAGNLLKPVAGATKAVGGAGVGAVKGVGNAAKTTGKVLGYGAAGGAALVGYGAYRGIKGVGDVVSGTGQAIGNIGSGGQR